MIESPVILLASERSGTNLLRAVFGAHRAFAAPTPPHLITTFGPLLSRYGFLGDDRNFRRLAGDVVLALENQLGEWRDVPTADELFSGAEQRSLIGLLDCVYRREMQSSGARRVFLKENEACYYANWLLRAYPRVKFVYLVRDGRDVVLSYQKSVTHFGSTTDAARSWRDHQRTCLTLLCDPALSSQIEVVHYEDLVRFPEQTIRGLCEFVEEPFDTQMLNFHTRDATEWAARRLKNWENISTPFRRSNYGKYRQELPSATLRRVEKIMAVELFMCGYPIDMDEFRGGIAGAVSVLSKGVRFMGKVIRNRRTIGPAELRLRLQRVKMFEEMNVSLHNEHLTPLLRCRALDGHED